MIWFTSDHHFGHKNIQKYESRPEKWVLTAIKHWNEVVEDEDLVIHLGDFSFASPDYTRDILDCLRGHKRIVLGNHDSSAKKMEEIGFEKVWGNRKQAKYGDNQFWMRYTVNTGNREVPLVLSHAPLPDLKGFGQFNIHGHIHSNNHPQEIGGIKPWHVNVSVDVNNYYPVNINDILNGYRGKVGNN
jgi:calcineurin-like phosphoesterase family protein